jgi:hypothetical protein
MGWGFLSFLLLGVPVSNPVTKLISTRTDLFQIVIAAMGRTRVVAPTHATQIFRNQIFGPRMVGKWAMITSSEFPQFLSRHGMTEVTPPHPRPGCRYFEIPLEPGEGVTGYAPLKYCLEHHTPVWAAPHREHGLRFKVAFSSLNITATVIRIVLGPSDFKETHEILTNDQLIIWDWFPHNHLLEESSLMTRCESYQDLMDLAAKDITKAVALIGQVDVSTAQRVHASYFEKKGLLATTKHSNHAIWDSLTGD